MIKAIMLEDDQEICETLTRYAKDYQIEISAFNTPDVALAWLEKEPFDLMVLDLTLPQMDGLEVCKKVRERHDLPIMIVSARATVGERVLGLEIGADDYMSKPFDPREFVARVNALVRTVKRSKAGYDVNAKFLVDESKHTIMMDGARVHLTMAEYEVLRLLINARGNVLSRDTIADNCDSMKWESSAKSVDVIISRIRAKIGDNAKVPQHIFVVKGLGYKFSA